MRESRMQLIVPAGISGTIRSSAVICIANRTKLAGFGIVGRVGLISFIGRLHNVFMINLRPWPSATRRSEPLRIYVNRSGGCDRRFSVHYWIEPAEPDANGRDWRFTWEMRDAESAARAAQIATEAWHFMDTELPAFVMKLNRFIAYSTISWADWCHLASTHSSNQQRGRWASQY